MFRTMERLDYKSHRYSDCKLLDTDCDECDRYYWKEIHADLCNESCTQRWVDVPYRCVGCTCSHCNTKSNLN